MSVRKVIKIISRILLILAGVYAALFAVFYFDLDGKLLYRVVEPALIKHYDKMPRRDVTQQAYSIHGVE